MMPACVIAGVVIVGDRETPAEPPAGSTALATAGILPSGLPGNHTAGDENLHTVTPD